MGKRWLVEHWDNNLTHRGSTDSPVHNLCNKVQSATEQSEAIEGIPDFMIKSKLESVPEKSVHKRRNTLLRLTPSLAFSFSVIELFQIIEPNVRQLM